MWNEPTPDQLAKIPRLYATENIPPEDKLIYLHFFIAGCDWYAAEFDEDIFFGYVILNGDYQMAEWGYFSLTELREINLNGYEIDQDLYWQVRPAKDVDKIQM